MLSSPPASEDQRDADRGSTIVGIARRAALGAVSHVRGLSWRDWLGWLAVLAVLGFWLGPRPYVEPCVDLTVRSLSFDSADQWDWATTGCTAGPRVRMVAVVKNLGTIPVEKHEATVRFVGRPAGGVSDQVTTFDVSLDRVDTSRRTDQRSANATVTLSGPFLTGPSVWSTTVIHADDESPRNDTLSGVTLTPCR